VIAKNRFVSVHVSSRSMGKSTVEGKIKSDWLETNIGVWVFLSDSSHHIIIKLLESESVSYGRQ